MMERMNLKRENISTVLGLFLWRLEEIHELDSYQVVQLIGEPTNT